jgi:5,5'-dehydrodivanillate O-demethylase
VLSKEENEILTRVGPGTPAGELLRRYRYPIAVANELTEETQTKFVRLLGEDLVLFRDKQGRVGLLADHCSHRGVSLLYGRVEERGIACAYHGWLYDVEGNCLECPAEPRESRLHLTVKHQAYPVEKFIGLYWTYMGPKPAPFIPKYDVWVRKDGKRKIVVYPLLDANWFQAMENSVDPGHLQILHQDTAMRWRKPVSTTRGFIDDIDKTEFYEVACGIMKRRSYKNGAVDEHPLLFPNILRQGDATQIRVPMDDKHTMIFFVHFIPGEMATKATKKSPRSFACRPSRIRRIACIHLPDLGRIWYSRRIIWSGKRRVRSRIARASGSPPQTGALSCCVKS